MAGGVAVRFSRILQEVVWCLLTEGRISYYRIRHDFGLDREGLDELRSVLVEAKGWATDQDGRFLVSALQARPLPSPPRPGSDLAALRADDDHRAQVRDIDAGAPPQPAPPTPTTAAPMLIADLPGAERRQLTVMFCDLVGSTDLSTRLDPEDLADAIRAYRDAASALIRRFDGFIAKYMGDGILVYFGYPHAQEKDAERAVRTCLAIVEAMPALNAEVGAAAGAELAVRVGVATGLVIVGETVGTGTAAEKVVVGETPNLAARLQGLARPNGVVVSALTRELAGEAFAYEDLGAHALKGIAEPVRAWSVTGLRQAEGEVGAGRPPPPLVGRDEELGLLRRAWHQARDEGHGQAVTVSGEPGIGKSALVQALRADAQAAGLPRMTFRCSPYHTNSALHPVVEHLRHVAGWQPEDDAAARLDKLERMLAGYSLPLTETVPLIAALLSLSLPTERYPALSLTPQRLKQQTEDVLLALTLEEAERRPVLQVWEDLHWADPSTLELLGLLIDQAPTLPILIVLTFRPDFGPPWPPRSHLTPITLGRLERAQVEALTTWLAGKALPGEVVEYIVRKTDGVPLYVEELTKAVLAASVLREEDGRYALAGPLSGLAIPASLQEVLMARLDRLPTVREVAQLGAVLGREFAYETLQAIGAVEEPKLRDDLGQLVGAELLYQRGRPPRATYVFKHALIQEAAYHSLLKRTRQQYHRQVAALLERRFPDLVEGQPELVAHHYAEAGCAEQAVGYWHEAARRAARRSANLEVIGHATGALELLQALPDGPERAARELQLQQLLGAALMATKGSGAAETGAAFELARELCRTVGGEDIYPALSGICLFELTRGRPAVTGEVAQEILQHASLAADPEPLLVGHVHAGIGHVHLGAPASGLTHFERCVALHEAEYLPGHAQRFGIDMGAAAHGYGAWTLWLLGQPDRALRFAEKAISLIEAAKHPFTTSRGLYWNAVLHQFRGEWSIVEERAQAAIDASREYGFAMGLATGQIMWGAARAGLGEGDLGIDAMREGLEAFRSTGARYQRTYFLTLLAEALRNRGSVEEGLTALAKAAELVEETGERYWEAEIHRVRAALLLAGGSEAAEVAGSCRKALGLAQAQQARSLELRAARDLARLLADGGDRRQAHDVLEPVYARFTEGFDTPDLREAKALLDGLAGDIGATPPRA